MTKHFSSEFHYERSIELFNLSGTTDGGTGHATLLATRAGVHATLALYEQTREAPGRGRRPSGPAPDRMPCNGSANCADLFCTNRHEGE